jgi:A/G-specific adenine glycosylase
MKGVGDYSASAISSIAFGEPHPAIDGNVLRVMTRYAGITEAAGTKTSREKVRAVLDKLIDREQPGNFNQAVMELGAMVCKPSNPGCGHCPIRHDCYANRHNLTGEIPVYVKTKPLLTKYLHYIVIYGGQDNDGFVWLKKRSGPGIWKNLYDFPLIEAEQELFLEDLPGNAAWKKIAGPYEFIPGPETETVRHLLSHRDLRVKFFLMKSASYSNPEFLKTSLGDLPKFPVPRLIENFLKKFLSDRVLFSNFPINQ